MYFNLFHGRKDRAADMTGPGSEGPSFQVSKVHGVYHSNIRVFNDEVRDNGFFWYFGDLILYNGVYYGDWSVTELPRNEVQLLDYYKMNK